MPIVRLERLFSSRFTRSTNITNQICRICVIAKQKNCKKSKLFFFNSFFLRAFVSSLLNKESMLRGTILQQIFDSGTEKENQVRSFTIVSTFESSTFEKLLHLKISTLRTV